MTPSAPHADDAAPGTNASAPAPSPTLPSPTLPSLNGRRFRMVSSTTSVVDPDSPSTFRYFEREGVVWGEYEGDTVTFGRFVGTRTGDELYVWVVHQLKSDGSVVRTEGGTRIERNEATGALRLVEDYEMFGEPQLSVCEEILEG